MNNVGLSKDAALAIETNYHDLYIISDQWVAAKLKQASIDGYITVAFGMRVRTPVLAQTLLNKKSTPYEASAESRTAGNALGQSYGMLNNRAAIEFQERTLKSKYKYDIRPIAQIHDAIYLDITNSVGCVEWVNKNLIECMKWQDLPELAHDQVKLGGNLEIYRTWADSFTIPNNSTKQKILKICTN